MIGVEQSGDLANLNFKNDQNNHKTVDHYNKIGINIVWDREQKITGQLTNDYLSTLSTLSFFSSPDASSADSITGSCNTTLK